LPKPLKFHQKQLQNLQASSKEIVRSTPERKRI